MKNSTGIDRRQVVLGGVGALALASMPSGVKAQASEKFVFGTGNLDPMFAAGFVALKNGYFAEFGLDASFIDCQNGPRGRQMLAAEQIDVCASASFDPMIISVAGKPTKAIFGMDRRIPYANVLVRTEDYDKGLKSFADLQGKRIGVSGPKSAFWLLAINWAEKAGLSDPDIRFIGGTPEMLAALKSGQIDATVATITMMNQAQAEGWATPIVSIHDDAGWTAAMGLGGDVPGQWIFALEQMIAEKPKAMQAFVNGWIKGNEFVFSHTVDEVADLIHDDFLRSYKRETLTNTLGIYRDKIWTQDNQISPAIYDRVIALMGNDRMLTREEVAKLPYAASVDMSFVSNARKS